jgi:starch-binding outer membrane protein, SusD/RagB family
MNKKIFIAIAAAFIMTGCKDLFEPAIENNREFDATTLMPNDSRFAFGVLLNGYTRIPTNSWSFNDVATDDAVSNDQTNNFLKIANGQWTANNNPLNQWTNSYAAIQYLNLMLVEADKMKWTTEPTVSELFAKRIKGEAYGLRALFMFHLLQSHAGVSESGELLGVPIILEPQGTNADFNKPRASFADCMKQLYADLDKAEELLPLDYEDISSSSAIPAKYGTINKEQYDRVFGRAFRGFLTARIAKAIRAKAALLAASPAYASANTTTWADAANYAGELISLKGGISGLASNGLTWFSIGRWC